MWNQWIPEYPGPIPAHWPTSPWFHAMQPGHFSFRGCRPPLPFPSPSVGLPDPAACPPMRPLTWMPPSRFQRQNLTNNRPHWSISQPIMQQPLPVPSLPSSEQTPSKIRKYQEVPEPSERTWNKPKANVGENSHHEVPEPSEPTWNKTKASNSETSHRVVPEPSEHTWNKLKTNFGKSNASSDVNCARDTKDQEIPATNTSTSVATTHVAIKTKDVNTNAIVQCKKEPSYQGSDASVKTGGRDPNFVVPVKPKDEPLGAFQETVIKEEPRSLVQGEFDKIREDLNSTGIIKGEAKNNSQVRCAEVKSRDHSGTERTKLESSLSSGKLESSLPLGNETSMEVQNCDSEESTGQMVIALSEISREPIPNAGGTSNDELNTTEETATYNPSPNKEVSQIVSSAMVSQSDPCRADEGPGKKMPEDPDRSHKSITIPTLSAEEIPQTRSGHSEKSDESQLVGDPSQSKATAVIAPIQRQSCSPNPTDITVSVLHSHPIAVSLHTNMLRISGAHYSKADKCAGVQSLAVARPLLCTKTSTAAKDSVSSSATSGKTDTEVDEHSVSTAPDYPRSILLEEMKRKLTITKSLAIKRHKRLMNLLSKARFSVRKELKVLPKLQLRHASWRSPDHIAPQSPHSITDMNTKSLCVTIRNPYYKPDRGVENDTVEFDKTTSILPNITLDSNSSAEIVNLDENTDKPDVITISSDSQAEGEDSVNKRTVVTISSTQKVAQHKDAPDPTLCVTSNVKRPCFGATDSPKRCKLTATSFRCERDEVVEIRKIGGPLFEDCPLTPQTSHNSATQKEVNDTGIAPSSGSKEDCINNDNVKNISPTSVSLVMVQPQNVKCSTDGRESSAMVKAGTVKKPRENDGKSRIKRSLFSDFETKSSSSGVSITSTFEEVESQACSIALGKDTAGFIGKKAKSAHAYHCDVPLCMENGVSFARLESYYWHWHGCHEERICYYICPFCGDFRAKHPWDVKTHVRNTHHVTPSTMKARGIKVAMDKYRKKPSSFIGTDKLPIKGYHAYMKTVEERYKKLSPEQQIWLKARGEAMKSAKWNKLWHAVVDVGEDHCEQKPFRCRVALCEARGIVLGSLYELLAHWEGVHNAYIQCPLCDHRAKTSYLIKVHLILEHRVFGPFSNLKLKGKSQDNAVISNLTVDESLKQDLGKKERQRSSTLAHPFLSLGNVCDANSVTEKIYEKVYNCAWIKCVGKGYDFKSGAELVGHWRKYHDDNKTVCPICLEEYRDNNGMKGMKYHLQVTHRLPTSTEARTKHYCCQYNNCCGWRASFSTVKELLRHWHMHHLASPICPLCKHKEKTSQMLRLHLLEFHGIPASSTKACSIGGSRKMYSCKYPTCKGRAMEIATEKLLLDHFCQFHQREQKCPLCMDLCDTKSVECHLESQHNIFQDSAEDNNFLSSVKHSCHVPSCVWRQINFSSIDTLMQHWMNQHMADGKWYCPLCGILSDKSFFILHVACMHHAQLDIDLGCIKTITGRGERNQRTLQPMSTKVPSSLGAESQHSTSTPAIEQIKLGSIVKLSTSSTASIIPQPMLDPSRSNKGFHCHNILCVTRGYRFHTVDEFVAHWSKEHRNEPMVQCPLCYRHMEFNSGFLCHMNSKHCGALKDYMDGYCKGTMAAPLGISCAFSCGIPTCMGKGIYFQSLANLMDHWKKLHPTVKVCPLCATRMQTIAEVKDHLYSVHSVCLDDEALGEKGASEAGNHYACHYTQCFKEAKILPFVTREDLLLHWHQTHHGTNVCPFCGTCRETSHEIKQHMWHFHRISNTTPWPLHTTAGVYGCPVDQCSDGDFKWTKQINLCNHLQKNHPSLKQCLWCEEQVEDFEHLVPHLVQQHHFVGVPDVHRHLVKDLMNVNQCKVSDCKQRKGFATVHSLLVHWASEHILINLGKQCPLCGQSCATDRDNRQHLLYSHAIYVDAGTIAEYIKGFPPCVTICHALLAHWNSSDKGSKKCPLNKFKLCSKYVFPTVDHLSLHYEVVHIFAGICPLCRLVCRHEVQLQEHLVQVHCLFIKMPVPAATQFARPMPSTISFKYKKTPSSDAKVNSFLSDTHSPFNVAKFQLSISRSTQQLLSSAVITSCVTSASTTTQSLAGDAESPHFQSSEQCQTADGKPAQSKENTVVTSTQSLYCIAKTTQPQSNSMTPMLSQPSSTTIPCMLTVTNSIPSVINNASSTQTLSSSSNSVQSVMHTVNLTETTTSMHPVFTAAKLTSSTSNTEPTQSVISTVKSAKLLCSAAIPTQSVVSTANSPQPLSNTAISTQSLISTTSSSRPFSSTANSMQSVVSTEKSPQPLSNTAISTQSLISTASSSLPFSSTADSIQSVVSLAKSQQPLSNTAISTQSLISTASPSLPFSSTANSMQFLVSATNTTQPLMSTAKPSQSEISTGKSTKAQSIPEKSMELQNRTVISTQPSISTADSHKQLLTSSANSTMPPTYATKITHPKVSTVQCTNSLTNTTKPLIITAKSSEFPISVAKSAQSLLSSAKSVYSLITSTKFTEPIIITAKSAQPLDSTANSTQSLASIAKCTAPQTITVKATEPPTSIAESPQLLTGTSISTQAQTNVSFPMQSLHSKDASLHRASSTQPPIIIGSCSLNPMCAMKEKQILTSGARLAQSILTPSQPRGDISQDFSSIIPLPPVSLQDMDRETPPLLSASISNLSQLSVIATQTPQSSPISTQVRQSPTVSIQSISSVAASKQSPTLKSAIDVKQACPFSCKIQDCSFYEHNFKKPRKLLAHWRACHMSSLQCPICKSDWKSVEELHAHLIDDHYIPPKAVKSNEQLQMTAQYTQGMQYTCKVVGCFLYEYNFKKQVKLIAHWRACHGSSVCCPICNSEWRNTQEVRLHLVEKHRADLRLARTKVSGSGINVHEDVSLSCKVPRCVAIGSTFTSQRKLICHWSLCHKVETFCPLCGLKSATRPDLYHHLNTHHGLSRESIAPVVGETWKSAIPLMSKEPELFCCRVPHCCKEGIDFGNESTLLCHLVQDHWDDIFCPMCGMPCGHPVGVRDHLKEQHSVTDLVLSYLETVSEQQPITIDDPPLETKGSFVKSTALHKKKDQGTAGHSNVATVPAIIDNPLLQTRGAKQADQGRSSVETMLNSSSAKNDLQQQRSATNVARYYSCQYADCAKIGASFVNCEELLLHWHTCHLGSPTCPICGKEEEISAVLRDHLATEHKVKSSSTKPGSITKTSPLVYFCRFLLCQEDGVSFATQDTLLEHFTSVHRDQDCCPLCEVRCDVGKVKEHLENQHNFFITPESSCVDVMKLSDNLQVVSTVAPTSLQSMHLVEGDGVALEPGKSAPVPEVSCPNYMASRDKGVEQDKEPILNMNIPEEDYIGIVISSEGSNDALDSSENPPRTTTYIRHNMEVVPTSSNVDRQFYCQYQRCIGTRVNFPTQQAMIIHWYVSHLASPKCPFCGVAEGSSFLLRNHLLKSHHISELETLPSNIARKDQASNICFCQHDACLKKQKGFATQQGFLLHVSSLHPGEEKCPLCTLQCGVNMVVTHLQMKHNFIPTGVETSVGTDSLNADQIKDMLTRLTTPQGDTSTTEKVECPPTRSPFFQLNFRANSDQFNATPDRPAFPPSTISNSDQVMVSSGLQCTFPKCCKVKQTFPDGMALILHWVTEHLSHPKCPFCAIQKTESADLRQHLMEVHNISTSSTYPVENAIKNGSKLYACKLAPCLDNSVEFVSQQSLLFHLRIHHVGQERCPLCMVIVNWETMIQHLQSQHNFFDDCLEVSEDACRENRSSILEIRTDSMLFCCQVPLCEVTTSFTNVHDILSHWNENHKPSKIVHCPMCGGRLEGRQKLWNHLEQQHFMSHSTRRRFHNPNAPPLIACERKGCKRQNTNIRTHEQLWMHVNLLHPSQTSCPLCGFEVRSVADQREHLQVSHGIAVDGTKYSAATISSRLGCHYDYCNGLRVGPKEDLLRHWRVKHMCSPQCPFCGLGLLDSALLRQHLNTHHKISTDDLVRKHSDNHPIFSCKLSDCSIMNLRFARLDGLLLHMKRFHVGCDRCPLCVKACGEEEINEHLCSQHDSLEYELAPKLIAHIGMMSEHYMKVKYNIEREMSRLAEMGITAEYVTLENNQSVIEEVGNGTGDGRMESKKGCATKEESRKTEKKMQVTVSSGQNSPMNIQADNNTIDDVDIMKALRRRPFACSYIQCFPQRTYTTSENLFIHWINVHQGMPRCPFCGIDKGVSAELRSHWYVDHAISFHPTYMDGKCINMYRCNICKGMKIAFRRQPSLILHYLIMHQAIHICPLCLRQCKKNKVMEHLKSHHNFLPVDGDFACEIVDEVSASVGDDISKILPTLSMSTFLADKKGSSNENEGGNILSPRKDREPLGTIRNDVDAEFACEVVDEVSRKDSNDNSSVLPTVTTSTLMIDNKGNNIVSPRKDIKSLDANSDDVSPSPNISADTRAIRVKFDQAAHAKYACMVDFCKKKGVSFVTADKLAMHWHQYHVEQGHSFVCPVCRIEDFSLCKIKMHIWNKQIRIPFDKTHQGEVEPFISMELRRSEGYIDPGDVIQPSNYSQWMRNTQQRYSSRSVTTLTEQPDQNKEELIRCNVPQCRALSFVSKDILYTHWHEVHTERVHNYICPVCEWEHIRACNVEQHISDVHLIPKESKSVWRVDPCLVLGYSIPHGHIPPGKLKAPFDYSSWVNEQQGKYIAFTPSVKAIMQDRVRSLIKTLPTEDANRLFPVMPTECHIRQEASAQPDSAWVQESHQDYGAALDGMQEWCRRRSKMRIHQKRRLRSRSSSDSNSPLVWRRKKWSKSPSRSSRRQYRTLVPGSRSHKPYDRSSHSRSKSRSSSAHRYSRRYRSRSRSGSWSSVRRRRRRKNEHMSRSPFRDKCHSSRRCSPESPRRSLSVSSRGSSFVRHRSKSRRRRRRRRRRSLSRHRNRRRTLPSRSRSRSVSKTRRFKSDFSPAYQQGTPHYSTDHSPDCTVVNTEAQGEDVQTSRPCVKEASQCSLTNLSDSSYTSSIALGLMGGELCETEFIECLVPSCRQMGVRVSNIREHWRVTHEENIHYFVCPICRTHIPSQDAVLGHIVKVHNVPQSRIKEKHLSLTWRAKPNNGYLDPGDVTAPPYMTHYRFDLGAKFPVFKETEFLSTMIELISEVVAVD